MAPHLVRAQSAYKDIRIRSFHHTHTHTHTLSLSLSLSLSLTHTHTHTHTHTLSLSHTHTHTHTHTPDNNNKTATLNSQYCSNVPFPRTESMKTPERTRTRCMQSSWDVANNKQHEASGWHNCLRWPTADQRDDPSPLTAAIRPVWKPGPAITTSLHQAGLTECQNPAAMRISLHLSALTQLRRRVLA